MSSEKVTTNSLSAGSRPGDSGDIGPPSFSPAKNGIGSLVSPEESIIKARTSNDSLSGEKPTPSASGMSGAPPNTVDQSIPTAFDSSACTGAFAAASAGEGSGDGWTRVPVSS